MTELLHIPFEPGLYDEVDPVAAGARLRNAENVRFHKFGRAEKRFGVQTMLTAGSGDVQFLTEFNGHKVYALQNTLRFAQGASAVPFVTSSLTWGNMSPLRQEVVARSDRGVSIRLQDCATANGIIVFVWEDGTYVYYAVKTSDNSVATTVQVVTGSRPRAITMGNTIQIVYAVGSAIHCLSINTITLARTGPASVAASTNSDVFDAAPYSSTQWLLAYVSAAQEITTALVTTTTVVDSVTTTGLSSNPDGITVYMASADEIWIAYGTDGGTFFRAFDDTLTALCAATSVSSTDGLGMQPVVYSNSGVKWIIWTGQNNTLLHYSIKRQQVNQAGTLIGPLLETYNFRLASKPFASNGLMFVVGSTDCDVTGASPITGWALQRGNFVLDLSSTTVAETPVHLHDAPQIGTLSDFSHVPSVVQRSDGVFCYPALHVLRAKTATLGSTNYGLDALYFTNSSTVAGALRDTEVAQRALYVAGGIVSEYTSPVYESGFFHYPVVVFGTGTPASGAIAAGTYDYTWVYEQFDPQGRRARSAPSDPLSVTFPTGTTNKITFAVSSYSLGRGILGGLTAGSDQMSPVMAHLYRTTNGGTTFYRVTENTVAASSGAPMAWGGASGAQFQYTDGRSDTSITANEILYTEGGVLANVLPPACQFMAEGGGRLWLGGLFNRTEVVCSKLLVPNEPAQFTGDATFSIYFPGDVTGLIWGDGALIAFTEDAIYITTGDGPNDQGSGTFEIPQRLPSDVGCTAWQSIVEIPQGWLFQSKRGIYLLPRGFGAPVFIGGSVQETLKSYPTVRAAVRVVEPGSSTLGESTVRFVVADSSDNTRVLVLNTATLRWESVDDYGEEVVNAGVWDDKFTYATTMLNGQGMRQEQYNLFGNRGTFVSTRLKTGDIRPFGQLGQGKVLKLQLMGEVRSGADLHAVVSFDGASGTAMTVRGKSGYAGERFYQQYNLPTHHCNSIDIDVWDRPYSGGTYTVDVGGEPALVNSGQTGASQGLVFHGATIEFEPSPGMPRLPEKDTA